jgi:hypothetical protein
MAARSPGAFPPAKSAAWLMDQGRLRPSATAGDTTPFATLPLRIEGRSREQRLPGMFQSMVLDVTIVGIVTCRGPQPLPNALNAHVLGNLLTWYGASELRVTGKPRENRIDTRNMSIITNHTTARKNNVSQPSRF